MFASSLTVFKAWNDDHAVAMCQTLALYLKKNPVIARTPASRLLFRDQLRRLVATPALYSAFQSASADVPSVVHLDRDNFRLYNDYQAISLCEALEVYLTQNPIAPAGSRPELEAELRALVVVPTFTRAFMSTGHAVFPDADPDRQVLLFDDDKLQDIVRRYNEDDEFTDSMLLNTITSDVRHRADIPAALNTMAFILNSLPLPSAVDHRASGAALSSADLQDRNVMVRFDGYVAYPGLPPTFCDITCTIKVAHPKRKRSTGNLSSKATRTKKAHYDDTSVRTSSKGVAILDDTSSSSVARIGSAAADTTEDED
ncbi:hypothetical protein FA95DRAFT_1552283 [Auriscalpium vulgare]|uniref:Uncharacterized protein n=1 Tax=Auriscalpium vulgare TaxID=40419 RepID=A0ACB8SBA2_9AGAM|nr:hypothetical protein FA95DRAFT_1552283 [Auriscalpium vulgare]